MCIRDRLHSPGHAKGTIVAETGPQGATPSIEAVLHDVKLGSGAKYDGELLNSASLATATIYRRLARTRRAGVPLETGIAVL